LRIKVTVPADMKPVQLDGVRLSAEGTDDLAEITAVRIYYYGTDSAAGAMNDLKQPLFGQSAVSGDVIQVAGQRQLEAGDHFLWVSYELSPDASLDHRVAVKCISVTVDGRAVDAAAVAAPVRQRTGVAVRRHMQDGVHTARIPGLARTNKGTLLAIFDARHQSARDLQGDMDIG